MLVHYIDELYSGTADGSETVHYIEIRIIKITNYVGYLLVLL